MILPNVGQVVTEEKFPQTLYHPTLEGSRFVKTKEEKVEAQREGWRNGYRHQEYPKMMHHIDPSLSKPANNRDEEDALLAQGYAHSPDAFTEKVNVDNAVLQAAETLKKLKEKQKELSKQN